MALWKNTSSNYRIDTEKWGWLEASNVKVSEGVVYALDVTREGEPFVSDVMIPLHAVLMIIPPKG